MPKKPRKGKHVPQRTCVGCREVHAKRTLIRVVRNPEGIFVDPTGKMAGRGAYLHDQIRCWELGMENALAKALNTDLTAADQKRLNEYMAGLSGNSND